MMLKTSDNEYIEVPDVEMERQAKLFDSVADTAGDFSYTFEFDNNSENRRKLNIVSPVDGFDKSIYRINDVKLCDNTGSVVYTGYLQLQTLGDTFEASFFSGNNNWFAMMSGDIVDLDMSEFELEITQTNIEDSWDNTEGIIFPWINTGAMNNRSSTFIKIDDFQPFIYVKNVVEKCFTQSGLKLAGGILSDWRYDHLITSTNTESLSNKINERIVKVSKEVDQALTGSFAAIQFEIEDSVGDLGLWDNTTYRYTADVRMQVSATVQFNFSLAGAGAINFRMVKNGVAVDSTDWYVASAGSVTDFPSAVINLPKISSNKIILEVGDYIEFQAKETGSGTITSGSLTITPIRLLRAYPTWILPDISQVDFVTNVFKLFNTVIDFDPFTKTVTVDLFKNVVRHDEIDLSLYVDPNTVKIDYQEIISDYAKINSINYDDSDTSLIKKYNSGRSYKYGSGQIDSGNEFVQNYQEIFKSIFVATAESINNPFGFSMPEIEFNELEFGQEYTANVTLSAGDAKFTVTEDFFPVALEIIEVFSSSDSTYIGQWMIGNAISDTEFVLADLDYLSNASVIIRRASIVSKNTGEQVLLLAVPNIALGSLTPNNLDDQTLFEASVITDNIAYAYFYKPQINATIDAYELSLSFGDNDIPLAYQRTMIDDYWQDFAGILQDPVKVFVDANLPKPVFDSITFKNPLRVKTDKFNTRFFPNRLTGYKDSIQPMTAELIKLPQ